MKWLGGWLKSHPKTTGTVVVAGGLAGAYYGVPAPVTAKVFAMLGSLFGM